MSNRNLVKVLLLVALLGLSLVPFSQARPGRGRKRAFGVGLLGGVVAGGVLGHMAAKSNQAPAPAPAAAPVTQVHHFYAGGVPVAPVVPAAVPIAVAVPVQPDPKKATVIETGPPDANGCYKQIIRQPNPDNPKTYTETENLICPTLQQVNQPAPQLSPSAGNVPVMPQPFPVIQVPAAGPPAPAAAPAAAPAPAAAFAPAAAPAPAPSAAPAPAPATVPVVPVPAPAPGFIVPTAPLNTPVAPPAVPAPAPVSVVPAVQPNAIPQPAPAQPQHVIVQSTHTVKKYRGGRSSSAPSLPIPQCMLGMLLVFYSMKYFLY